MKKFFIILFLCILSINIYSAKIDDDMQDLLESTSYVKSDFELIAGFLSSEISNWVPFAGSSAESYPANTSKFPGININGRIGVEVARLNIEGLKSLELKYLPMAIDTNIKETNVPVPVGLIYLGTGLNLFNIKGEIGIKGLKFNFSGVSEDKSTTWLIEDAVFGMIYKILILEDNPTTPAGVLTMFSINFMSGRLFFDNTYQGTDNVNINNTDYDMYIDGKMKWKLFWNIQNIGIKVIINKTIAFLNPFIGLGTEFNFGEVTGQVGVDSDITLTDLGTSATKTEKAEIYGYAKNTPKLLNFRLLGGLEIKLPFGLSFDGIYEWGGEVYSISAGLRLQIP